VVVGNNMNFKEFYENYTLDEEKTSPSSQKLGTYSELVFSVGLVEYLLKDSINPDSIISGIKSLDKIIDKKVYQHDNYNVVLNLHGNDVLTTLIGGAFDNLALKDKNNVMEIVNSVATNIPKLHSIHDIDSFKAKAKNLPRDSFNIVVNCTGAVTGVGGKIKNDVSLEVVPKIENVKVPQDIEKVIYSLKYNDDSKGADIKVADSTLFEVIFQFSKLMGLKMTKGIENWSKLPNTMNHAGTWLHTTFENEPYRTLSKTPGHFLHFLRLFLSIELKNTYKDKTVIVKHFESEFLSELKAQEQNQPEFSNKIYDFLEKHIFGEDKPSLIKISKNQIHEFNVKKYKEIKSKFLIKFNDKKSPSKFLSFIAYNKLNSFELFWIDNLYESTLQIKLGPAILTQG